jgi:hypothetical protein
MPLIKKYSAKLVRELEKDSFPQKLDDKVLETTGGVVIESFMGEKYLDMKIDNINIIDLFRTLIGKSLSIPNFSLPGMLRQAILGTNRKKDLPTFLLT